MAYVRAGRIGLGRYRRAGLGDMLPAPMGPPVDPNAPVTPPDVQQQIADLWDSIFAMQPATPAPAPSFSQWINAHAGTVAIAGIGFFVLMAAVKR